MAEASFVVDICRSRLPLFVVKVEKGNNSHIQPKGDGKMRYMLLIYTQESVEVEAPPAEQEAIMNAYFAFSNEVREAGAMLGGEALQPTTTATTVRVREGKTLTADGPFAETNEQLGGYYMLDCPNLDEAIAWASKIPGAKHGSVEIRPLVEFD
jgi:hypothetical protein